MTTDSPTRLLRIDSSSRVGGSHSRQLADAFERSFLVHHPQAEIVRRDLASDPIPHIADETITGFYTPQESLDDSLRHATALSDQLIDELEAADGLLLSVPMYNFTVPSALKAWIDQIVRVGRTFAVEGDGLVGLLKTRCAVVVTASGASFTGTPYEPMDFLRPYLQGLLGFLGVQRIEFLSLEGTTMDPDAVARAMESRVLEAETLAASLFEAGHDQEQR